MKNCPYHEYYINQAGSGAGAIYRGSVYQRGHGIGSFLGGIFRTIMPLLSRGAKTVGRELLKSGAGFLGDLAVNMPAKEAFQNRVADLSGSLKRKVESKINNMAGSGIIKRRRVANKGQKPFAHHRMTSVKRRRQSSEGDIFD